MADLSKFNTQDAPDTGFEPIPSGKFLAAISGSEMKETKKKTGRYLELEFTLLEGQFKNRKLWSRLNLENPKEAAVRFALAELASICRAVGVMAPKDSTQLHDRPLVLNVTLIKNDQEHYNEIKGYAKAEAADQAVAVPAGGGYTPPWVRS